MPLPGSDVCVPALLGMEYPDPMGSGLSVPVLGCQTDPVSGIMIPLAGTMEDPDGKGIVNKWAMGIAHCYPDTVYLIHISNPLNNREKNKVTLFCIHAAALLRFSGHLLWISDYWSSDRGAGPSGWSQAGCIQKKRCTCLSFLLANGGGSNW